MKLLFESFLCAESPAFEGKKPQVAKPQYQKISFRDWNLVAEGTKMTGEFAFF